MKDENTTMEENHTINENLTNGQGKIHKERQWDTSSTTEMKDLEDKLHRYRNSNTKTRKRNDQDAEQSPHFQNPDRVGFGSKSKLER